MNIFLKFGMLLILITVSACSNNTYWVDLEKKKYKCEDEKTTTKGIDFKRTGHLNTVHLVAEYAGLSEEISKQLAFYTQVPDDKPLPYSAPLVGVWGVFDWSYRHDVMAILHSLHGGNDGAVLKRRDMLKQLIEESLNINENWKTGFLIHALGDSYAHVKNDDGQLEAYGELFGHAFDFSNSPDIISADNNVEHYVSYVNALFNALDSGQGNREMLNIFIGDIRKASEGLEDDVTQVIYCAEVASNLNGKDEILTEEEKNNLLSKVSIKKVKEFLDEISNRLE